MDEFERSELLAMRAQLLKENSTLRARIAAVENERDTAIEHIEGQLATTKLDYNRANMVLANKLESMRRRVAQLEEEKALTGTRSWDMQIPESAQLAIGMPANEYSCTVGAAPLSVPHPFPRAGGAGIGAGGGGDGSGSYVSSTQRAPEGAEGGFGSGQGAGAVGILNYAGAGAVDGGAGTGASGGAGGSAGGDRGGEGVHNELLGIKASLRSFMSKVDSVMDAHTRSHQLGASVGRRSDGSAVARVRQGQDSQLVIAATGRGRAKSNDGGIGLGSSYSEALGGSIMRDPPTYSSGDDVAMSTPSGDTTPTPSDPGGLGRSPVQPRMQQPGSGYRYPPSSMSSSSSTSTRGSTSSSSARRQMSHGWAKGGSESASTALDLAAASAAQLSAALAMAVGEEANILSPPTSDDDLLGSINDMRHSQQRQQQQQQQQQQQYPYQQQHQKEGSMNLSAKASLGPKFAFGPGPQDWSTESDGM